MSAQALIELRGVSKEYASAGGVVRALQHVDLRIDQGEFVAIVGTSGSGKSTLMNILGCLDRPSFGEYFLLGMEVGARSADARAVLRNRLIGFIFQGFNLLSKTSALENVELPLSYRGVPAKARRARAERALCDVGLAERMDHAPNQLSGGQQQRVAIARALVTDPPLLLADEPTGNLDTRTSLEVLSLLQRLNRELGITIVLVTHEPDIAACASRVITVRDGLVVEDTRNVAPVVAADALSALPPPQLGKKTVVPETPTQRAARLRGGPLPRLLVLCCWLLGLCAFGFAALYDSLLLQVSWPWLWWLSALLVELYAAPRLAQRWLGRALTADQRLRLASWCSALWALSLCMPLLLQPSWWPRAQLRLLQGAGMWWMPLGLALACCALTALRYGGYQLLSPRTRAAS